MGQPTISIISVPFGYGAGRPGSEQGPDSILKFGLVKKLEQLGYDVDAGRRIQLPTSLTPYPTTRMKHVDQVMAVCSQLAREAASAASAGSIPLMLGGTTASPWARWQGSAGITRTWASSGWMRIRT